MGPVPQSRATTTIDRPAHRVWPIVSDLPAIQRHHPGVREALARGPRSGLGAARECRFRRGTIVEEAVEWNEGRSYTMRVARADRMPIRNGTVDIDVEPQGDQTRLVIRLRWTSSGVFWPSLQGVLLKPAMSRVARAIVRNVRQEAESA